MPVQITFPKQNDKLPPIFFAAVRASADIKQVAGTLTPTSGGDGPVQGTTIAFQPRMKPGDAAKHCRWLIVFPDPFDKPIKPVPPGVYTLNVTGKTLGGVAESAEPVKDLTVSAINIVLQIFGPQDGETIDPVDFVAYGIRTSPIQSATMNTVHANFIYDDPDLQFWSAQFPELAPGCYTLAVVDSNNTAQSRIKLRVGPGPECN
jgi:hypothetical protein